MRRVFVKIELIKKGSFVWVWYVRNINWISDCVVLCGKRWWWDQLEGPPPRRPLVIEHLVR
jgi:hypothetical protein